MIYLPKTERLSHYYETRAVEPLDLTPAWVTGDPPETFPFGERAEDIMKDRGRLIGGLLVGDGLPATARDLGNRAKGAVAELRSRLRREGD